MLLILIQVEVFMIYRWKYDGQRVQIHAKRGKAACEGVDDDEYKVKGGFRVGRNKDIFVRLFSRHLEVRP